MCVCVCVCVCASAPSGGRGFLTPPSVAEERLRESEEAHRKQLETKQMSHDNQMTKLAQQKDREIEEANRKVS